MRYTGTSCSPELSDASWIKLSITPKPKVEGSCSDTGTQCVRLSVVTTCRRFFSRLHRLVSAFASMPADMSSDSVLQAVVVRNVSCDLTVCAAGMPQLIC